MQSSENNFNFRHEHSEANLELVLPFVAEETIVQTILEGSGGQNDIEMTEPGLRFVRHLLATSRPARNGFVPNFADMEMVRYLAREFMRKCGSATDALQTLIRISHYEQA